VDASTNAGSNPETTSTYRYTKWTPSPSFPTVSGSAKIGEELVSRAGIPCGAEVATASEVAIAGSLTNA